MRDENQLHAAVVELVALEDAEIKYSTVQNCPAPCVSDATYASPSAAPRALAAAGNSTTGLTLDISA